MQSFTICLQTNRKSKSDTKHKGQNNQKYNKKLKPTQDGNVSGCKHTNFRNLDHLLWTCNIGHMPSCANNF